MFVEKTTLPMKVLVGLNVPKCKSMLLEPVKKEILEDVNRSALKIELLFAQLKK